MKTKNPKTKEEKNRRSDISRKDKSQKPFFSGSSIQPKLTIGQPDDQYEREADAMADKVVNNESSILGNMNKAGAVQPKGEEEELQMKTTTQKEEEEQHVQTKLDIQKMGEEEEEVLQGKFDVQRQGGEEEIEEEPVQTKLDIQKMGEEEEEVLQGKFDVQRQGGEEEIEEEPVQAKLDIQKVGEEEEEVMQGKFDVQRQGGEEEIEEEPVQTKLDIQKMGEEEEEVQTKSKGDGATASPGLASQLGQKKGKGQAMPRETTHLMSQAFGHDFSQVNIHTDTDAVQMNKGLGAKAFTHGSDIYFNKGEYNPGSPEGKRLLAHELTHVVQQGAADVQPKIQRTIGDGHDLQSPRFSGNTILEAAYDPGDRRFIRKGERGYHVRLIQQSLLDMGYDLPRFGADGDFGNETRAAIRRFQRDVGIGVDGVVGPITMGRLDQLEVAGATGPVFGTSITDSNGITWYSTRAAAVAQVPTHVSPDTCFVWNGGSNAPQGYPWRVIPGTGCAHWVAHELGITGTPGCDTGHALRVSQVIAGRTRHNWVNAQVGDIWTNTSRSHTGLVRAINRDPNGNVVSIRVEHDSSGQGGVVTNNFTSGYVYR